ncbi:coiled-coil domain-containing protein 81-like [Balearica regulorum gibbericeps]|uniref:coiled-coil domain-containing protein 81-like n=1 Tax=Balearica regulorum gibbericeps TaxID=100784 RepID=UPI003F624FE2
MTDLQELITNIELCSSTDGSSTITFPTLKKLSVSGTRFPRQWVTLRDLALKGTTSWWKKAEASQRFGPCHRWVYPVRRTLASAVSLSAGVLMGRELADLELDVSFPCFPDVVTIWSSVSKHVQQQLLQRKPRAVRVPGLGTFLIKKWLSFENGEVLTFQRPLFVLSRTVAQIRELQHASVPVPDDMKKVSVSWKKIHSDVPYSEEVVQNCMQETLKYFCFILRNRKDTDFILKDLGTLAIRGTEVTMAFCKDFLLRLNKSTYVVEKLLAKKLVISDKEVTLSLSHFGHVYQLPQ